jgi:hypothetical protein
VLLTGQVHATCTCPAGLTAAVTWSIIDDDGTATPPTVGPTYSTTLTENATMAMLPVSALDKIATGTTGATHNYKLRAVVASAPTPGAKVTFTAPQLTAVDLGR